MCSEWREYFQAIQMLEQYDTPEYTEEVCDWKMHLILLQDSHPPIHCQTLIQSPNAEKIIT